MFGIEIRPKTATAEKSEDITFHEKTN